MSRIEGMMRTILGALDIDIEALKEEVTGRIKVFEANVETLNTTLIALHKRTRRTEAMLEAICEHLNIQTPPQVEETNEQRQHTAVEPRKSLPAIAGRN